MERWRTITSWNGEAGFQMGLDEALLEATDAPPTLRFYTWSPAALSLGYFQRFADVPAAAELPHVVRRITGGGAIHHEHELTFSIATALEHPLYRGPVADSYRRVHEELARVLGRLGARVDFRGENGLGSDREHTGMCFHESTPLDLVWGARKGVGSAQRRRAGRVLHHGSIKLAPGSAEVGVAGLREHAPDLTAEDLRELLLASLADAWSIEFSEEEPSETELARARALAPRYGAPEFVRRR